MLDVQILETDVDEMTDGLRDGANEFRSLSRLCR